MNNRWLEEETKKVQQNQCRSNESSFFLISILIILCTILGCYSVAISEEKGFTEKKWPGIWTCKKCGYENYDLFDHCAVCGEKR
jgi:predicted nucleic acid-binding Zn ribbon protein